MYFGSVKEFLSSKLVADALLLRYFLISDLAWLWSYYEMLSWTFNMLMTYGSVSTYYTVRTLIVIIGAVATFFITYAHFKGAIYVEKRS